MSQRPDPVLRLFEWARETAPPTRPETETPPLGFATRVLANAAELPRFNPWEQLAVGALPIAASLALASLWLAERNSSLPAHIAEHEHLALAFLQTSLEP